MQLILNKKVVLLLCFTINLSQFIECSTQLGEESVATQAKVDAPKDAPHAAVAGETEKETIVKDERARNVRNAVVGGVQHNYRSSYVGNRLNRRVATNKQFEATTTEQLPLAKAKRKLTNEFNDEVKYNVGPGVNIGVEKDKELVSVYLDEDCLKDVFTGEWFFHLRFARVINKCVLFLILSGKKVGAVNKI